ncbi:MAG: type III secretion system gatekeeper subunit SctW, partial [Candidatus Adiutrix sp.]|nr:type III secretion system gatekeeper subunit SctW [Candidatus Adiutrix sp.]
MTAETRLDGALSRVSTSGGRQAGTAREAGGQYKGLAVSRQNDPMSILADMAEELSWMVNEYEEMSIEDRKSARDRKGLQRKSSAESSSGADDLDEEDLEAFIGLLRQQKVAGKEDISRSMARVFREPFHRHAALTRAREELSRDDPELAAQLEKLQAELEELHGPEIRAGYNLARVSASGLAGGPAELRSIYAETILDCESLTQAMQKLVERYGAENFPAAVGTLFKAVSADLSAAQPSLDPVRLKVMMDDMYQLEVLGNTYR